MKKILFLCLGLSAFIWTGATCNNPSAVNAAAFNSETLAADGATAATHTFNVYAANVPATPALAADKAALYSADTQLAATLSTLDSIRLEYTTNSASTNATSMQVALDAVASQSSNIVALVKMFMSTNQ